MDYNCIRVHLQHHLQHKSPHFRISSLVLLLIVMPTLAADDFTRIDPLALLSGTLRTYQRAGCDHDFLQLTCPRGTTISIEFVQYGKYGNKDPAMCPDTTENTQNDGNIITSGTEIEIKTPEKCMWPQAQQYSLLQIVVEACQKKRRCKFLSSPKTFGGDPCPGHRKFIEVAYKCRPTEFRSKVSCENDIMSFECNPYSRIAINAASYGRTEYESLQCPQQPGVKEENCLASYATETVMQYCHGRRRCNITADQKTFGKPCQPDSRMYLKVIYTCLPRKILIDRFESTPEPDEPLPFDEDNELEQEEIYDEEQFYKESESPGPAPKLQSDLSNKPQRIDLDLSTVSSSSSLTPPQPARDDSPSGENQERLYVLLIISATSGVILCLLIIAVRWLLISRRRPKEDNSEQGKVPGQFKNSNTGETTITNGFSTDDISEIDADIDLTTTMPMSGGKNDNFNTYTPSPSPYGNLGPSNLSHTSSTLLMPQSSISSSTGPPSLLSGSINPALIMPPPSSATMTTGFVNIPSFNLSGTLPRHHPVVSMGGLSLIPQPQQPSYISSSILGHPTMRRQSSQDMEQNMPRILSRNATNVQYYYG